MPPLFGERPRFFLLLAAFCWIGAGYAQSSTAPVPSTVEQLQLITRIARLRLQLQAAAYRQCNGLPLAAQQKAAGIIAELLNRAEQRELQVLPKGRFDWSWSGFDQPDGMVGYADSLLQVLAAGRDPFEGKFAEPGGHVVDHALIEKDGKHHLFYIRGTAATSWAEFPTNNFGHAISTNLKDWTIEEPVLQAPEKGWDNYQVWAPYILRHKGKYFMFYAGVNNNVAQAIGLATSDDLYHWERYSDAPVITTGRWGIWDSGQWSDCRDPMVLQDGDTFYCYYTAQRKDTVSERIEPCIGISSSTDLYHWKDEGFIRLEMSLDTPPESPFVVRHDGRYYLFYTSYRYGTVYATSAHPVKGWRQEAGEGSVLIPGVSASEVYQSKGQWYLSLISHQRNGLHFFEIRRMSWDKMGWVRVEPPNK